MSSCGVRGPRAPACRRHLRHRQRLAVELAVGGQRKPLQNHEGRRNHVVGQAATQMLPQRRGIRSLIGAPQPHRPPAACCPACPPAQSPPPAPRSHAAPAPPRSRQARCGTRAPSPGCRHAPESPKPRPAASAPGPRSGTSGSPQGQTDRPQTAPPSAPHDPDTRAPVPLPLCKAPPLPQPVQAPIPRPRHKPACSRSDAQSESASESIEL